MPDHEKRAEMRCRTSRISLITGSFRFCFIAISKQCQGRHQRRHEKTKFRKFGQSFTYKTVGKGAAEEYLARRCSPPI